ncbi:MAG: deoxyhypusine synthase family protein, partial [Planctomycetota bacterium]
MSKSRRSRTSRQKKPYLSGKRILPNPITGREKLSTLIDETFLAYNSARLREGCELLVKKMLRNNVTLGLSLSGALTPAGLGCAALVPLIRAGFVDWIVSTGANLYHDLHFALNCKLYAGTHKVNDAELRRHKVIRIYDILFDSEVLRKTDMWVRRTLMTDEFQKTMSSAELHYLLGKYAAIEERKNGLKNVSVLAAAHRCGVPVYTSSPGDSSIGMHVAALELEGYALRIDPAADVNETTAIVLNAKRRG